MSTHEYEATDLASALPAEWGGLADYLPVGERHRHHLCATPARCSRLASSASGLVWTFPTVAMGRARPAADATKRRPGVPVRGQARA
jgi:hypothetical protein